MSDTAPHRPPRVPLPQHSLFRSEPSTSPREINQRKICPISTSPPPLPSLTPSGSPSQPRLVNPSYPFCLYPHPPPSIPNQNHTKYRNYFLSEQTTMMMHQKPTVCVPPWSSLFDDPSAVGPFSGVSADGSLLVALQRYQNDGGGDGCEPYDYDDSDNDDLPDSAIDTFSCDEFRMYEFKVRRCARGRSHDWTECPFAHPGEKARRRDPRKYHYSGTACPDFRKGSCKRGDACDMAHGVFECWLHPARYRTQPCKDGTACRRRVCFFAHTPDQLRVLPQSPKTPLDSYDGSPLRQQQLMFAAAASSQSPPMSPTGERGGEGVSPRISPEAAAVLASLRNLQLGKVKSGRGFGLGFGSPRGLGGCGRFRAGFCSLPTTPTRAVGCFDGGFAEEECVERVESGRALRAKMYERLSKESSGGAMEKLEAAAQTGSGPDVGWVSELLM